MSRDDLRRMWRRMGRLHCGCSVTCRCDDKRQPTDRRVDAYIQAVQLLDELGYPAAPLLPELRELYRQGGANRRLAETVVGRWAA